MYRFWLRNIRFFNTKTPGHYSTGVIIRRYTISCRFMENWMSKIFSYVHRSRKHWECKYYLISYKLTIHLWNSSIYLTFTASCRINPIRCALSDHSVQTIKPWFIHISGRTSRGYIYPLSYFTWYTWVMFTWEPLRSINHWRAGIARIQEVNRLLRRFSLSCTDMYPLITDMPFINYLHWLQWKLRASTVTITRVALHCSIATYSNKIQERRITWLMFFFFCKLSDNDTIRWYFRQHC